MEALASRRQVPENAGSIFAFPAAPEGFAIGL
jgi:hypothetical protein